MAFYECVLIARQDVSSSQVESLVADYTKILEDNGGRVAGSEYWGLRTLAYQASRKNRKGHYVLLNIEAPAPAHARVGAQPVRLSDDVDPLPDGQGRRVDRGPLDRHAAAPQPR